MLSDSFALRKLLGRLLPGLSIEDVPGKSGQRVVYFCRTTIEDLPFRIAEDSQVVLKVSEGVSATQTAYLEKEIFILKSLKSPHYPKLLWNGTFTENPITGEKLEERLFVTIEERVNAKPLRAVMSLYRKEKEVLKLLLSLVEALEPLWHHSLRLVHRDLKPENILLGRTGHVFIIDLGIMREEGARGVTYTFSAFGPCTPHYASPEQAKNDKRNITFKSDFFSLGVIAYELLSGKLPFGSHDLDYEQILTAVVAQSPATLQQCAGCSEKVSRMIERLMGKEPYQRYRTVDMLKSELTSILNEK